MISKKEFLRKYNISDKDFKKTKFKWSDLENIYKHYEKIRYKFAPTAKDIVERLLKIEKVHSVRYRIKDSEHLIEKVIRKKIENPSRVFNENNYLEEISDVIGVRALHLFKQDWNIIHDHIIDTWDQKEEPTANVWHSDSKNLRSMFIEKWCKIEEHKRGYRSVHYIIESNPTKQKFTVEIQVRTIFEEAWSEIDHTIRYPYNIWDPILEEYLGMFNILAGNADQMWTYIKFLQSELQNKELESRKAIEEKENTIQELRNEIESLEIDTKTKKQINTGLDSLLTTDVKSLNNFWDRFKIQNENINTFWDQFKVFNTSINTFSDRFKVLNTDDNIWGRSLYIKDTFTCSNCGKDYVKGTTNYNYLSNICSDCNNGWIYIGNTPNYLK